MDERLKRAEAVELAGRKALVRAKAGRRWNRVAEEIFFGELALTANVLHSAEAAGMTGVAAYRRRKVNPAFAVRWLAALDEGYAALEMLMLRHALEGVERTETVIDADGTVKEEKRVRTFPHGVGMRLLQSHRETVERYRAMESMRVVRDPGAIARIHEALDLVGARLRLGAPEEEEEVDG